MLKRILLVLLVGAALTAAITVSLAPPEAEAAETHQLYAGPFNTWGPERAVYSVFSDRAGCRLRVVRGCHSASGQDHWPLVRVHRRQLGLRTGRASARGLGGDRGLRLPPGHGPRHLGGPVSTSVVSRQPPAPARARSRGRRCCSADHLASRRSQAPARSQIMQEPADEAIAVLGLLGSCWPASGWSTNAPRPLHRERLTFGRKICRPVASRGPASRRPGALRRRQLRLPGWLPSCMLATRSSGRRRSGRGSGPPDPCREDGTVPGACGPEPGRHHEQRHVDRGGRSGCWCIRAPPPRRCEVQLVRSPPGPVEQLEEAAPPPGGVLLQVQARDQRGQQAALGWSEASEPVDRVPQNLFRGPDVGQRPRPAVSDQLVVLRQPVVRPLGKGQDGQLQDVEGRQVEQEGVGLSGPVSSTPVEPGVADHNTNNKAHATPAGCRPATRVITMAIYAITMAIHAITISRSR